MSKYRIKQIGDEYFPQVKFYFAFGKILSSRQKNYVTGITN